MLISISGGRRYSSIGRKRLPEDQRKTGIMINVRWVVLELLEKQGKPNRIIEQLVEEYYLNQKKEADN